MSEVLATVQELLKEIIDDDKHPLFDLVSYSVKHGVSCDTGRRSHLSELVGDLFIPYIATAIDMVVTQRLLEEEL